MAITENKPLSNESFIQLMRDSISESLEGFLKDEYEIKKAELIASMDKKFYNEVAAIALSLSNLCDYVVSRDRLVITVHKKEPEPIK